MFFEMKQDAIKQGWLFKKSSGSGTLGRCVCVCVRERERERDNGLLHLWTRRNWKNRYFALRGKTLFYYSESDLATAKPNGAIDLKDVT